MLWSTCVFVCVIYVLVCVFHELHVLFLLHLDIRQQHFALFLRQFQGLYLGNNTQGGQTLQVLGKNTAAINVPFMLYIPVLPAGQCEPVKPERPLAAAVFLCLSADPLVL